MCWILILLITINNAQCTSRSKCSSNKRKGRKNAWIVLPVWLENWTELMESTSNPKTWKNNTHTRSVNSCFSWNSGWIKYLNIDQRSSWWNQPNPAGICTSIKANPWLWPLMVRTQLWQNHVIQPFLTWFNWNNPAHCERRSPLFLYIQHTRRLNILPDLEKLVN